MDLKQIKELIKIVNDSEIGELKIADKDFKIVIRHQNYHPKVSMGATSLSGLTHAAATTPSTDDPEPVAKKEDQDSKAEKVASSTDNEHLITVKSPMIGTFYRASSPEKPPYAKVGDHIGKEDVLCIIEAMKLFNEIESEVSGTIVKVLVENQSPVEYDQPLFLIDPNG